MTETGYQAKIMKAIQKDGGVAINGNYTTEGEADLQCGLPVTINTIELEYHEQGTSNRVVEQTILIHVAVEVKTEDDYNRVMRAIDEDYNVIDKTPLKPHEVLQMAKIRRNRKLGGLALVAWNYKQVKEYVDAR